MPFNSPGFVILVTVTFVIYYLPPLEKFQRYVLIAASLAFYASHRPGLTLALILVIAVNTAASRMVLSSTGAARKAYAAGGIAIDLVILALFKYGALFARTFSPSGATAADFFMLIPLPVGISFYIFKGISLVADTFKNKEITLSGPGAAFEHGTNSFLYMAFFPQLLAGPIERAGNFFGQAAPKSIAGINWEECVKALILGYFLKMVVADNLKDQTFWIAYPYFRACSSITLVSMIFGFSMQMFADFAGYSLIAIAVSALFGYRVKDNFNFPYIARSFSDFWRRWHISLSTFLRDYLYIPLGGNRKGSARTYANLIIVMFLGGLWHGAGWNFAAWGTLHGLALAAERFARGKIRIPDNPAIRSIKIAFVFTFVSCAWIFFRLTDFSQILEYARAVRANTGIEMKQGVVFYIFIYSIPVILYHLMHIARESALMRRLKKYEYILYGILLFLIINNSGSPDAFIYFQF